MLAFLLLSILCTACATSNVLEQCSRLELIKGHSLWCQSPVLSLDLNDCYANGQDSHRLEYKPYGNAFDKDCRHCTISQHDYIISCECRHGDQEARTKVAHLNEVIRYESGSMACLPPSTFQMTLGVSSSSSSDTRTDGATRTTLRMRSPRAPETEASSRSTAMTTTTAIAESGRKLRGGIEGLASAAASVWADTPGLFPDDVASLLQGPFSSSCKDIQLHDKSFLKATCTKGTGREMLESKLDLNECFKIAPYAAMEPSSRGAAFDCCSECHLTNVTFVTCDGCRDGWHHVSSLRKTADLAKIVTIRNGVLGCFEHSGSVEPL